MKGRFSLSIALGILSFYTSLAHAHSGDGIASAPHILQHLLPVLVTAVVAVLVARVVWLKRLSDS